MAGCSSEPTAAIIRPPSRSTRGHRYFAVTEKMVSATNDFRLVAVADLQWLINDHGPKFAGQSKKASGASAPNRTTRAGQPKPSAKARCSRLGGASYEEMRDALLKHEDPEIADWANTKGMADDERELHSASTTRHGREEPSSR